MEPLLFILVPGILGGIVVALLMARSRPASDTTPVRRSLTPPSPMLINMARIRVDGFGGLGMVAMAVAVALFEPRVRMHMLIALVSGIALAVVLILRRQRDGSWTPDDRDRGAHSLLPLDTGSNPAGSAARDQGAPPRTDGSAWRPDVLADVVG